MADTATHAANTAQPAGERPIPDRVTSLKGREWEHVGHWEAGSGLRVGYLKSTDGRRLMQAIAVATPDAADAATLSGACRAYLAFNHAQIAQLGDLASVPGWFYLLSQAHQGIDVATSISRRGSALAEALALSLLHEVVVGMQALHAAGLSHGLLDLRRVRITESKQVVLTGSLPSAFDRLAPPAARDFTTLAAIAPELVAGQASRGLATEMWSLGVCLHGMIDPKPLYEATNTADLVVQVRDGHLPDLRKRVGHTARATQDILAGLLAPDPSLRYTSYDDVLFDVDRARQGREAQRSSASHAALPAQVPGRPVAIASRSGMFEVEDLQQHVVAHESQPATAPAKLSVAALRKLVKMVRTSQDGLRAWLVLAPGAAFPKELVQRLMIEAGISHGLRETGVYEASRPADMPRKIILAEGQEPRPGVPGMTVRGEAVDALNRSVVIEVADDGMQAVALTPPDEPVSASELEAELAASGVKRGVDRKRMERLISDGAETGRTVIATGQEPEAAELARWELAGDGIVLGEHGSADLNQIRSVRAGDRLGVWVPGTRGSYGYTVTDDSIKPPAVRQPQPPDFAGEGTGLARYDGDTLLMAERSGVVGQLPDGSVRVLPLKEILGDLGPQHSPMDTTELLVVRGSILDGAEVHAAGGVMVRGDVGDALIDAGGDLTVMGAIGPGRSGITVAGRIQAASATNRSMVAAEIQIDETVAGCQVVATGSIRVGAVVGGSLVAAGDIEVHGDAGGGSECQLWAGHHAPNAIKHQMAKLTERRLHGERGRMVTERKRFAHQIEEMSYKDYMYSVGGYMQKEYLEDMRQRLEMMKGRSEEIDGLIEEARGEIVDTRQEADDLAAQSDDRNARIAVHGTAQPGLIAKVADRLGRPLEASVNGLRISG